MTMRSTFGQVQDRAPAGFSAEGRTPGSPAAAVKELPYDHVATFTLLGQRGNRVQDVINVSIDGTFVAVAVGYSFIPAVLQVPIPPPPLKPSSDLLPSESVANWLLTMFRDLPALSSSLTQSLIGRFCGIDFKYSVIDSATGRELQNKPIHNIAGLGEPSGQRPFRPLAKPMLFMPRSTIRIEVEEISEGPIYPGALLYIVLQGYKILG